MKDLEKRYRARRPDGNHAMTRMVKVVHWEGAWRLTLTIGSERHKAMVELDPVLARAVAQSLVEAAELAEGAHDRHHGH